MTTALRTIPQVLDRVADRHGEHDALITDDRQLTFAQLRAEVRRAAAATRGSVTPLSRGSRKESTASCTCTRAAACWASCSPGRSATGARAARG